MPEGQIMVNIAGLIILFFILFIYYLYTKPYELKLLKK